MRVSVRRRDRGVLDDVHRRFLRARGRAVDAHVGRDEVLLGVRPHPLVVRDEATGALANIGKAYSGLTDAEIAEMTTWFEAHTIARYGRYRQVEPTVIVEIAFDGLQRSSRYPGGLALRFARVIRYRHDKSADEADTIGTVQAFLQL